MTYNYEFAPPLKSVGYWMIDPSMRYYSPHKPKWLKRFMMKWVFDIKWVDEIK
jgi:hypothetical protein